MNHAQNLDLSYQATLPSLFPGLDKVGALQHISPVLTLSRVSSHAAYLRRTATSCRPFASEPLYLAEGIAKQHPPTVKWLTDSVKYYLIMDVEMAR